MINTNQLLVTSKQTIFSLTSTKKIFLTIILELFFISVTVKIGKNCMLDKYNNTIIFKKKIKKRLEQRIKKQIKLFTFMSDFLFFKKLKFTGKNYKITKKKKKIKLSFGKSHKTHARGVYNVIIKKRKKNKLIAFSNLKKKLATAVNKIFCVRKVNPYTKRGLKINRHVLKRRKGKKG